MDVRGVHIFPHPRVLSFRLGNEDTCSRWEKVLLMVPLAVMGHAHNANLKVQGSRKTGSVSSLR